MIFHRNGQRELFQLAKDLSETRDVLSGNPETGERLTTLLRDSIDRGCSTPGPAQQNDFRLSLPVKPSKSKSRRK